MMKIKTIVLSAVASVMAIAVGLHPAYASSTSQKTCGFYNSSLVSGIGGTGPIMLATMAGYTNLGTTANPSASSVYSAIINDDVVFMHVHGAAGLISISASGTNVTANMLSSNITTSNAKLVYVSACQAGNSSTTYGNIGSVLCGKGVDAVVAFTGNISASTTTNGIHYFNQMLVGYMCNGYTLYNAIPLAKSAVYNKYGSYYGADTCVFYGNGGITL